MAEVSAATSAFSKIGGELLDKILSSFVMIFIALLCGTIIFLTLWYIRHLRKFNVKVELKSLRGSGTLGEPVYKIVDDKAGMIWDKKDRRWYFRLQKEKVDLPPPPLDCLEMRANGKNRIRIFQKSQDEYFYLLPDKINLDYIIKDGKKIAVANESLNVIEGDISYWNSLRKRDNRKLFDTEAFILKILPYLGIFFMFVTVIFLTYIISDNWGIYSQAAQALKEAAIALRDVNTAQLTPVG